MSGRIVNVIAKRNRRVWLLGSLLVALIAGYLQGLRMAVPATPQEAVDNSLDGVSGGTTGRPGHARRQFKALTDLDTEARKESDQWIIETKAIDENQADKYSNELSLRIEHRLHVVKREYQNFIKLHPRFAAARESWDNFEGSMNEKIQAVKEFERARFDDPSDASAWSNLAHYFSHNGPVKNVFACYEKAVELEPGDPVNYQNLATAIFLFRTDAQEYLHMNNEQQVYDRALEYYSKALAVDPTNFSLAVEIAQSYYVIKPARAEQAISAWQGVLKLAENEDQREDVYLNLARFEITAGRLAAARSYLNRVSGEASQGHKETILRRLNDLENPVKPPTAVAPPPSKT